MRYLLIKLKVVASSVFLPVVVEDAPGGWQNPPGGINLNY
jgi:hypothetical protein